MWPWVGRCKEQLHGVWDGEEILGEAQGLQSPFHQEAGPGSDMSQETLTSEILAASSVSSVSAQQRTLGIGRISGLSEACVEPGSLSSQHACSSERGRDDPADMCFKPCHSGACGALVESDPGSSGVWMVARDLLLPVLPGWEIYEGFWLWKPQP